MIFIKLCTQSIFKINTTNAVQYVKCLRIRRKLCYVRTNSLPALLVYWPKYRECVHLANGCFCLYWGVLHLSSKSVLLCLNYAIIIKIFIFFWSISHFGPTACWKACKFIWLLTSELGKLTEHRQMPPLNPRLSVNQVHKCAAIWRLLLWARKNWKCAGIEKSILLILHSATFVPCD